MSQAPNIQGCHPSRLVGALCHLKRLANLDLGLIPCGLQASLSGPATGTQPSPSRGKKCISPSGYQPALWNKTNLESKGGPLSQTSHGVQPRHSGWRNGGDFAGNLPSTYIRIALQARVEIKLAHPPRRRLSRKFLI